MQNLTPSHIHFAEAEGERSQLRAARGTNDLATFLAQFVNGVACKRQSHPLSRIQTNPSAIFERGMKLIQLHCWIAKRARPIWPG